MAKSRRAYCRYVSRSARMTVAPSSRKKCRTLILKLRDDVTGSQAEHQCTEKVEDANITPTNPMPRLMPDAPAKPAKRARIEERPVLESPTTRSMTYAASPVARNEFEQFKKEIRNELQDVTDTFDDKLKKWANHIVKKINNNK
ncbi:uncharacterized protein LOC129593936 [Paramacrobiotus metropolitanus]|uniref:uncharacterized protein LOC129593936 n=1 Tax=Paramacrobiotus metropolitanus TaxID=2943436 RepID=UPI00244637A3|nr:uncharacterized protein LOC129593936 [Paramacrobiotus metropolitanus]